MLMPPHPLYVSRPFWLRLGEAAAEGAARLSVAIADMTARHAARVRSRRERAALRHLSPNVLRDIGAADELLAAARERDRLRGSMAEPWRHGL